MIHTVAVAFLAAGAFFSVVFFSAVFFSVVFFSALGSAFLVAVAAAGLASFFASFTGPEVPMRRVSHNQVGWLQAYNKTRKGHVLTCEQAGEGGVLTLGTCKVTLLLSGGDGTVDVAAEGSIA